MIANSLHSVLVSCAGFVMSILEEPPKTLANNFKVFCQCPVFGIVTSSFKQIHDVAASCKASAETWVKYTRMDAMPFLDNH